MCQVQWMGLQPWSQLWIGWVRRQGGAWVVECDIHCQDAGMQGCWVNELSRKVVGVGVEVGVVLVKLMLWIGLAIVILCARMRMVWWMFL